MSAPGYVYAIESGDAVKIGFAKDPVRRSHNIGVGSHVPYRLVGFVAATPEQEKEIHGLLSRWRIRGEWFRREGPVMHFLSLLLGSQKTRRSEETSGTRGLILRAIVYFGTEAKLAAAAGVSQPVINDAKRTGKVGPRLAIGIEAATGGKISRSQLRPDLWEPTEAQAAE
jgi:DNA-binding transcriptional regulator YdaS (Cro superfamily)